VISQGYVKGKGKCNVVPVLMKAYGEVDVQIHIFLTLVLLGGQYCFSPMVISTEDTSLVQGLIHVEFQNLMFS
jgi:hypothetical protein